MIFVFGSNLAGRHGAGAAWVAKRQHGAIHGLGIGPQGNSYAIPTKGFKLEVLPLDHIEKEVAVFLAWAEEHPIATFQVTRIGCGYAGYKDEDIAPMFKGAPGNCRFDEKWRPWLGNEVAYWGTF